MHLGKKKICQLFCRAGLSLHTCPFNITSAKLLHFRQHCSVVDYQVIQYDHVKIALKTVQEAMDMHGSGSICSLHIGQLCRARACITGPVFAERIAMDTSMTFGTGSRAWVRESQGTGQNHGGNPPGLPLSEASSTLWALHINPLSGACASIQSFWQYVILLLLLPCPWLVSPVRHA